MSEEKELTVSEIYDNLTHTLCALKALESLVGQSGGGSSCGQMSEIIGDELGFLTRLVTTAFERDIEALAKLAYGPNGIRATAA